jgi:hypothetical protein
MGMRMAKASREDLDAAYELSNILEALDRGYYPARDLREDSPAFFDSDNIEHLQDLHERLLAIARKSSLFRVVGGLETLLSAGNAVVDPESDCIELHPRIKAALSAPRTGDAVGDGVRYVLCQVGFVDHYRDWLLIPHVDGQYVTAAKLQPFSMAILQQKLAAIDASKGQAHE